MDAILFFVDIFLHVDQHLNQLANDMGWLTYLILFGIIFAETGLVVTPFLPGDSLLFAIGALCATTTPEELADPSLKVMRFSIIVPLLILAALCGDVTNYAVGHMVGPGFLEKERIRFIKKEHLLRTQAFYKKHGGKTIILARFVPIVRTFAPFMAGISRMPFMRYAVFCVSGAVFWITSLTTCGVLFGNIPWVKKNFSVVVLAIVAISLMPMVVEYLRARREKKMAAAATAG